MEKLIRHGELVLKPIDSVERNWETKKDYIASHSETGHHHMVVGLCNIFAEKGKDVIMKIDRETKIEHKKSFDKHDTLIVPAGTYKLLKKREYDPFQKVMREIWD